MYIQTLGLALTGLLALIALAEPTQTALDWYPLRAGNSWIYEITSYDDNGSGRAHPEIHRWAAKETVRSTSTTADGTLVIESVDVVAGTTVPGRPLDRSRAILIRQNCVYRSYVELDPQTNQLKADYRRELAEGHLSPDFCFPLEPNRYWGAPHWGDWRPPSQAKDWLVAAFEPNQNAFHIRTTSSYLGSGESADIWFRKGVGPVLEKHVHHGTLADSTIRLLSASLK